MYNMEYVQKLIKAEQSIHNSRHRQLVMQANSHPSTIVSIYERLYAALQRAFRSRAASTSSELESAAQSPKAY